jgi:hypothetical protein
MPAPAARADNANATPSVKNRDERFTKSRRRPVIGVASHVAVRRVAQNLHEHHSGVESLAYATGRSARWDGNAWQNVGNSQSPNPGCFLGAGPTPRRSRISACAFRTKQP